MVEYSVGVLSIKTHWGRGKWSPFSRRHFEMNFLEWNVWIWMQMSLKFVPRVQLTISHIVSVGRPGDKPSSETMMVSLLTQICITQSQWANYVTQYCHRSSTKASPLLIKATYVRSYMRVTAHQIEQQLGRHIQRVFGTYPRTGWDRAYMLRY